MTDGPVSWLRTQLDEDERVARRSASRLPGADRWIAAEGNEDGVRTEAGTPVTRFSWPYEMEHIARHDPARVLTEVAAKRRIIDASELAQRNASEVRRTAADYSWIREADAARDALLHAVRLLASVYAGRPGWRSEWAPDEKATP